MNGKSKNNNPNAFVKIESNDEVDTLIKILAGEEKPKKQIKSQKQETENNNLITYLENDGKRLEKLADLFDHKLTNNYDFNQSDKLLQNQLEANQNLKENICELLLLEDNPILPNFFKILDRQFQKIN
jgi:hypothetical protein